MLRREMRFMRCCTLLRLLNGCTRNCPFLTERLFLCCSFRAMPRIARLICANLTLAGRSTLIPLFSFSLPPAATSPSSSPMAYPLWRLSVMPFLCLHIFSLSFWMQGGRSLRLVWCSMAEWPLGIRLGFILERALASSYSANVPGSPRLTVWAPTSPGIPGRIAQTPTATVYRTSAMAGSLLNSQQAVCFGICRLLGRDKSRALRLRRGLSTWKPLLRLPRTRREHSVFGFEIRFLPRRLSQSSAQRTRRDLPHGLSMIGHLPYLRACRTMR
jgi:hypothetical protein